MRPARGGTAAADGGNGRAERGIFRARFIFSLGGFYIVSRVAERMAEKAASCGKGALTGAVVYVSLVIVSVIIFVILAVGLAAAAPIVP